MTVITNHVEVVAAFSYYGQTASIKHVTCVVQGAEKRWPGSYHVYHGDKQSLVTPSSDEARERYEAIQRQIVAESKRNPGKLPERVYAENAEQPTKSGDAAIADFASKAKTW